MMATCTRLHETRCDRCFLMAPLKEVHRSKCLTKNYCSEICRSADDAVHKVCCNPDKGQRRIEERKVKIGGQHKVEAASARMDSMAEYFSKKVHVNPEYDKKQMEIIERTKTGKLSGRLAKKKKKAQDDEEN